MRISMKKLSSSFLLLCLSCSVWSKPIAQVVKIEGQVFVVTNEGKTSALKTDQHIDEKSEVLVEEGASITINDYYDASYHLIGGSHLKLFNKSLQLKKGKAWIQSRTTKHPLVLTTANGHISYTKSEFIVTFDQATARSQVLVVNGEVEASNILNESVKHMVPAGSFSMIDPEVDGGTPRAPTKVGPQSLDSALAEFKVITDKEKLTAVPKREIASVENASTPVVKKGEIIFMKSHRHPASVKSGDAHKYFKKMVTKNVPDQIIPVAIYGASWTESKTESVLPPRAPASVQPTIPGPTLKPLPAVSLDLEFMDSLKRHESEQPKNPQDLQNLIDELKSY
jgi:hypothetical protein